MIEEQLATFEEKGYLVLRKFAESEECDTILDIAKAHHNSIMTKMPLSGTETLWHQDIRYWRFNNDNLVSVWLALGEENDDNGVLEFIPGSHKMTLTPDQFGEKEYFLSDYAKNSALVETKEQTVLQKGDVVLFHCKLLHRANENRTQTPRISFVYTVRGESNHPTANTRSSSFPEIILE